MRGHRLVHVCGEVLLKIQEPLPILRYFKYPCENFACSYVRLHTKQYGCYSNGCYSKLPMT